ncbi:TetR/AcrR family transcriptional regulator [Kineosporia sp. A_224]|uniref:TetR/AcrR family transcriptional regulator n=1 Tax=Kineosporia sp. A_224 TaxID=1962180 RepID=UPI001304127F|nr:TetR/AcrR family transcriptional regulator [Kineosporia sp. A_224]
MTSALELALVRGFSALTVDEVARSANASKTTLMRFFGGRRGLIEATLALEMELVVGPLEESSADLVRFGAAFQQIIFSERCLGLLRFVLHESATDAGLGEAFRGTVLAGVRTMIGPAVSEALGLPLDDPDVVSASERYLGDLVGVELLRALSGDRPDAARLEVLRGRAVRQLG